MWKAANYLKGKYFQNQLNLDFIETFSSLLVGDILDIGCGDGELSYELTNILEYGSLLAIDSSSDMIEHAQNTWQDDKLTFQAQAIESLSYSDHFDLIVSFWCLHWTQINCSLDKIYQALKPKAKAYLLFSSFTDNSILQTWSTMIKQNHFPQYSSYFLDLKQNGREYFFDVINTIIQLPFNKVNLELETKLVKLPDISYFTELVLTMPFMQDFPHDILPEIVECMAKCFIEICEKKHNGQLIYETRPIYIQAQK